MRNGFRIYTEFNCNDFGGIFEMRTIHDMPTENPFNDKTDGRVIGWISGGVASAIACKRAYEKWGDRVEFIFCDKNSTRSPHFS